MSVIGIISMKGGVGKTTTTANLAAALTTKLGSGRVFVVDLDPQNALHMHFGYGDSDVGGICEQSLSNGNWREAAFQSEFGVTCMPYGTPDEPDRKAFESLLAENENWVGSQIQRTGLNHNSVMLIDTPPGSSVYLKQVFACADIVLLVLLADAGSYATIPAMQAWLSSNLNMNSNLKAMYVLNQIDRSEPLNRDISDSLKLGLGKLMAPIGIHTDEAVSEALAFLQPVLAYEPHGQASHDYAQLASLLINTLNK
jgi:cellulose synthase operon protein YhjQ